MKKPKQPTVNIRIYKASHKRFKIMAAQNCISIVELLDRISKGV